MVVIASQKTGFIAVFLSSVIPLLILIAVLSVVFVITENEVCAALLSLFALIPYYFALYCVRNKIRARLSFHIDPLSIKNVVGNNL